MNRLKIYINQSFIIPSGQMEYVLMFALSGLLPNLALACPSPASSYHGHHHTVVAHRLTVNPAAAVARAPNYAAPVPSSWVTRRLVAFDRDGPYRRCHCE